MRKVITNEMIDDAQELYAIGMSYQDIAKELYKNYGVWVHTDSIRNHVKRKLQPKLTKREKLGEQGIEKVLCISDLHVPFQREDILEIINRHKDEVSTIILCGDIIDCHAISSFPTLEPRPLASEMAECHKLLKEIQDLTPNVRRIMVKGNHEARFEKYLIKRPSELNALHSSNILTEIVNGFEVNDRQRGTTTTYDSLGYEVIDSWFVQYNDMIACHPLSFSRVAAKTAQSALDYFVEHGIDFKACLVAHTHKISSCFKYGKYAVETGCLCKEQEYANKGKLSYTQQQCGYVVAVFNEGKYDINESKQYILE